MNNMIRDNEIDEVKKLIQNGFDLELISFELDIPLKKIQQIKQEIDEQKRTINTRRYSYDEIVSIRNEKAHTKMQQMRERYRKLYFTTYQKDSVVRKELSEEEMETINSSITTIQNIIKEMKDASKYKRRKNISSILAQIKKIQDYQLTIEQAEQLNVLLSTEELRRLSLSGIDSIDFYMSMYKKIIVRKLVEAVDIAQRQTEDLEELKVLDRKIASEIGKESPILVATVKSKIYNKILKIKQNKALEKIKNDIPENISRIIDDLVNGTVDIEKANEIIKEEAKKKVESKPKTNFSLTEQQEEKQILIQIGMAVRKKSDRYHITNPELTTIKLQELCEIDLRQAAEIVVENLVSVKDFEGAKRVCDKFTEKDKKSQISKEMRNLKLRIRNAEISDIVLKGLNMQGTEEERKFFELIEKGIEMGNLKLESISLGKNQDGTKNITLADIWTDENQRENMI